MVYKAEKRKFKIITSTAAGKIYTIMIRLLSLLLFQTCSAALISIQPLVPILDSKRTSNVDELLVENQRTQMRQNYVLQRDLNADMDKSQLRTAYDSEPFDPNIYHEGLPDFILDHANMIRNNIILLDNSVETQTRKRGNIRVKKYKEGEIKYIPCSCEQESKKLILLGDDHFPRTIETKMCNETLCPAPYGCRKIKNDITVLKRKKHTNEESQDELPDDLFKRWVALKKPVTVGCMCTRDYRDSDLTKK